jgi:endonuclease/exonuclease/phosphatase family metal-dependent hydrolase
MRVPGVLIRCYLLKRFVLTALFSVVCCTIVIGAGGNSPQTTSSTTAHRIVTCNILLDLPEQHGTPADWNLYRRAACMQVIQSRHPDIICVQEMGRSQNEDFIKAFPGFIAFGYPDPYVDRNPKRFQSIKNVILYSRERYEQTGAGTYWLSNTPLIAGSRLPGTKLPRHVTWLRLRERQTGREFRVLTTHFALEQPIRVQEANLLVAEAAQYSSDFPQILTGDLNATATAAEIRVLRDAAWIDTFEDVHEHVEPQNRDTGTTGVATSRDTNPGEPRKIDYILYRGKVKSSAAEIIRDRVNGHAPSDHNFVSADVELFPD